MFEAYWFSVVSNGRIDRLGRVAICYNFIICNSISYFTFDINICYEDHHQLLRSLLNQNDYFLYETLPNMEFAKDFVFERENRGSQN